MPLIETMAREALQAQHNQRAQRAQIAENSARQAFFTVQHQVSGVGFVAMTRPVEFDVTFTHRPAFTHGAFLAKVPDVSHYRYPVCHVGVYKWLTEPTPEARARHKQAVNAVARVGGGQGLDNSSIYSEDELLYKGAYLYFHLVIHPAKNVRTDGSNLTALQAQLASAAGANAVILGKLVAEAKEAQYLIANPPSAQVIFSLVFMGTALKGLSDELEGRLHADPAATPIKPSYLDE